MSTQSNEDNPRTLDLTADPSTVFYIHPFDTTAQSFVSEKFEGQNYLEVFHDNRSLN